MLIHQCRKDGFLYQVLESSAYFVWRVLDAETRLFLDGGLVAKSRPGSFDEAIRRAECALADLHKD